MKLIKKIPVDFCRETDAFDTIRRTSSGKCDMSAFGVVLIRIESFL